MNFVFLVLILAVATCKNLKMQIYIIMYGDEDFSKKKKMIFLSWFISYDSTIVNLCL